MTTPFFPAWRACLGPLKTTVESLHSKPLPYLQGLFGSWIPKETLAQSKQGPNSRQRVFPLALTFWAFLGQILSPGTSCREILRQVMALFCLQGQASSDEQTGGYCQARKRLPLQRLQQILGQIAQNACRRLGKATPDQWWGHPVKVVDGCCSTMADTPANQKCFPQPSAQKPGCGFPLIKFVGLFCLTTGCLLTVVTGNYYCAELSLFRKLWHFLKPGDILLADRNFSDYGTLAALRKKLVHCVVRMNQARPKDFRQGRYLGPSDRLITWEKPRKCPRTIGLKLWASLPERLTLRMIRVRCAAKGYRTRELILITTLLDPQKYSSEQIAQLYLQRWSVELFLRHIKTTLKMEHLRCLTPCMVQKEFFMHCIGYNLIRAVMVETVRKHNVPLQRLSFKGTLDSVRQYSLALAKAKTKKKAAQLLQELLRVLANDLVLYRPGRREPRAIKRRPKGFGLLSCHRHRYREIPHRGKRRKTIKC